MAWPLVDLDEGRLRVAQTLTVVADELVWSDEAKTDAGTRVIALDPATVAALRAHRTRQLEERMMAGPGWTDHERGPLVFAWPDGGLIHPDRFLRALKRHAKACRVAEGRRAWLAPLVRDGGAACRGVPGGAVQAAGTRGHLDNAVHLRACAPGGRRGGGTHDGRCDPRRVGRDGAAVRCRLCCRVAAFGNGLLSRLSIGLSGLFGTRPW